MWQGDFILASRQSQTSPKGLEEVFLVAGVTRSCHQRYLKVLPASVFRCL